ncbi:MAG TPA: rod shape-determining protein MreC [Oligoflexia bacterium]|nr:rod shape-determining protein MreC [Oligoflexia bacterium]HMR24810.1 rod shape-determining protein MreC [Oligoflexia bacterium]
MNKPLRIAIAIFLVSYLGIQIISVGLQKKQNLGFIEKSIIFISLPLQKAAGHLVDKITSTFKYYVFLTNTAKENDQLKKQIDLLQSKIKKNDELLFEAERLRDLLSIEPLRDYVVLGARRVALGASPNQRMIRLAKGRAFGVEKGMPVVHSRGLVGLVLESSIRHSDVLVLSDKTSVVDVINQRTRRRALLRGYKIDQLKSEYFSATEDVKVGDIFITSGLDDVYPKGLPIGFVSEVQEKNDDLFLDVYVKTYVDYFHIEEVGVVVSEE